MINRPFPCFDVVRITEGGVYSEDRGTGWQPVGSVEDQLNAPDIEKLKLGLQRKDLPGRKGELGILKDRTGVATGVGGGACSADPLPLHQDKEPIVRWLGTRVEMREVLLDGLRD